MFAPVRLPAEVLGPAAGPDLVVPQTLPYPRLYAIVWVFRHVVFQDVGFHNTIFEPPHPYQLQLSRVKNKSVWSSTSANTTSLDSQIVDLPASVASVGLWVGLFVPAHISETIPKPLDRRCLLYPF